MIANIPLLQSAFNFILNRILICEGCSQIFEKVKVEYVFTFFRDISPFALKKEHNYCFKLICKLAIKFIFLIPMQKVSNHVPWWVERSSGDTDLQTNTLREMLLCDRIKRLHFVRIDICFTAQKFESEKSFCTLFNIGPHLRNSRL
jgi:hypothetical protein